MKTARLSLVRHGQSEANVSGRWQGHGDSDLSPLGREQAAALGERLAKWELGRFWSSDLVRAADTARATADALGREITFDPQMREIDVGAWEGLTRDEVAQKFPHEVAALGGGQLIAIGGGESWLDLAKRAGFAIAGVLDELEEGEHGVLFSHGGFIASYVAAAFGISRDKPRRLGNVANTSVTTIEFSEGRARLVRFNDTTHLAPLGAWGTERLEEHGGTAIALSTDADVDAQSAPPPVEVHALGAGVPNDPREAVDALVQRHPRQRVALTMPSAMNLNDRADLRVGLSGRRFQTHDKLNPITIPHH